MVTLSISLGLLIGLAVLAGEIAETYAAAADLPVDRWFDQVRDPQVVDIANVVTQPGSSAFLVPFVAVVGLALWVARRSARPLAMLVAAYVGSLALTRAAKAVVDRARPPQESPAETFTGSAFPSGHAAKAAAVFLVLGALLTLHPARTAQRVVIWSSVGCVAVAVAVSRLFLGAHWLSDVLAGVTFGALWGLAVLRFPAAGRHGPRSGRAGT